MEGRVFRTFLLETNILFFVVGPGIDIEVGAEDRTGGRKTEVGTTQRKSNNTVGQRCRGKPVQEWRSEDTKVQSRHYSERIWSIWAKPRISGDLRGNTVSMVTLLSPGTIGLH